MRIPDLPTIGRRYVRGVIQTYLDGRRELEWALGCIRQSGVGFPDVVQILAQLRSHEPGPRWERLSSLLQPKP